MYNFVPIDIRMIDVCVCVCVCVCCFVVFCLFIVLSVLFHTTCMWAICPIVV